MWRRCSLPYGLLLLATTACCVAGDTEKQQPRSDLNDEDLVDAFVAMVDRYAARESTAEQAVQVHAQLDAIRASMLEVAGLLGHEDRVTAAEEGDSVGDTDTEKVEARELDTGTEAPTTLAPTTVAPTTPLAFEDVAEVSTIAVGPGVTCASVNAFSLSLLDEDFACSSADVSLGERDSLNQCAEAARTYTAAQAAASPLASARTAAGATCAGTTISDAGAKTFDACEELCRLEATCNCVALRKSDGNCRLATGATTTADGDWDACLMALGAGQAGYRCSGSRAPTLFAYGRAGLAHARACHVEATLFGSCPEGLATAADEGGYGFYEVTLAAPELKCFGKNDFGQLGRVYFSF